MSPDLRHLRLSAQPKIAVVGLGYVGLPLAVAFGRYVRTIGFDIDSRRIAELERGEDHTLETDPAELKASPHLSFSAQSASLESCRIFIVTVPTPIDASKKPDLGPLMKATELVGRSMKRGALVIYESTVFPGATEEVCVPILEAASELFYNDGFFCGYSPERVNPGDKQHRLADVIKVTAGSTPEVAEIVDKLYASIVPAGTFRASSIRVAEAAKVIENTQRDVNIALVNELALIFRRLGLDTLEVLEAAGTKWNFLPFRPGLVGGHCIGVDPYYLTHKAQQIGYLPEVILAGRRVNDGMGSYIADEVVRLMAQRGLVLVGAKVLVLGLSFKENCPDVRNSRVTDVIARLSQFHLSVSVYDPWVDTAEVLDAYNIVMEAELKTNGYDAIVVCVAHRQFVSLGASRLRLLGHANTVLYDVKGIFPREASDGRL